MSQDSKKLADSEISLLNRLLLRYHNTEQKEHLLYRSFWCNTSGRRTTRMVKGNTSATKQLPGFSIFTLLSSLPFQEVQRVEIRA
jgi:hypothetical protein